MKREGLQFCCLFILFASIMLVNLDGWDLLGADEPRYAQIAREMMETGQYIVPHLNGETYPDKPPLFFWLIALASKPFGDVNVFSARFPSVLAGLGLIVVTYFFARKLYDPLTGLLAAFILFTNKECFDICLSVHFDPLLSFWTTLALFLFYQGYTNVEGGKKYFIISYISMGLALLTKGPVGFAVPLITIVLFLIFKREIAIIRHIELGKGTLIILGMLALWLVPACIIGGGEYTNNIVFKQTFSRTVDSFAHKAPFYYYLIEFPADFLPWTVFIPGACIYFWKNRMKKNDILFPLVWFGGTFLLFSLVSGKRSLYLLPLYPAAALVMAKFWRNVLTMDASAIEIGQRRFMVIPCYLLLGAAIAAGVITIPALLWNMSFIQDLAPARPVLFPVSCLAGMGGAGAILYLRRKTDIKYFLYTLGLFLIAVSIITVLSIFPAVKSLRSGKLFCDRVQALVGPADKLIASFDPKYFNYCLHRYPIPELRDIEQLEKLFSSPQKVFYLAKESDYENTPEEFKSMVVVLEKGSVGHRIFYLLSNKSANASE